MNAAGKVDVYSTMEILVSFPDPSHGKEGSGRVAIGKLSKWNVIIH